MDVLAACVLGEVAARAGAERAEDALVIGVGGERDDAYLGVAFAQLPRRIAVIAAGEIIAQGMPQTLGDRQLFGTRITFAPPSGTAAADLPPVLVTRAEQERDGRIALSSSSVAADLHSLSGWALERGVELNDLEVRQPTLEDVYLDLTANDQPRNQ